MFSSILCIWNPFIKRHFDYQNPNLNIHPNKDKMDVSNDRQEMFRSK